jgi:hypothetical protein
MACLAPPPQLQPGSFISDAAPDTLGPAHSSWEVCHQGVDYFQCSTLDCVSIGTLCNGVADCPDGSDEAYVLIHARHFWSLWFLASAPFVDSECATVEDGGASTGESDTTSSICWRIRYHLIHLLANQIPLAPTFFDGRHDRF